MAATGVTVQDSDYEIPNPPTDSVSHLSVNESGTMLIASSWDKSVT